MNEENLAALTHLALVLEDEGTVCSTCAKGLEVLKALLPQIQLSPPSSESSPASPAPVPSDGGDDG
jgi:hypothetical protein